MLLDGEVVARDHGCEIGKPRPMNTAGEYVADPSDAGAAQPLASSPPCLPPHFPSHPAHTAAGAGVQPKVAAPVGGSSNAPPPRPQAQPPKPEPGQKRSFGDSTAARPDLAGGEAAPKRPAAATAPNQGIFPICGLTPFQVTLPSFPLFLPYHGR